jgi:glycosyltransferase involved in cell wall biosynthesis
MRILMLTDGWSPLVSGVVTTVTQLKRECEKKGHRVRVLSYKDFKITVPCPTYSEIRLPLDLWTASRVFKQFRPDAIDIATPEGSVGLSGILFCRKHHLAFTTAYHTKLPDYVRKRFPIPERMTYAYLRRLHRKAEKIFVSTQTIRAELEERGFPSTKLVISEKGVDHDLFNPDRRSLKSRFSFEPPVLLYVGRVAVEKNLEKFLGLDLPGTKVVVGDGPARHMLTRKYPDVVFTGYRFGEALATYYAIADVFVFPSLTDTLGIVLLEALACGTPIAAYHVTGPKDVVTQGLNGFLGPELRQNIDKCLSLDRDRIHQSSKRWSWERVAEKYLKELCPIETAYF